MIKKWKDLPLDMLWRRTTFLMMAFLLCSVATAYAAGTLSEAITTAERVERLGAFGVLVVVCILLGMALLMVVRLYFHKIQDVIDRNTRSNERVEAVLDRLESKVL